jgi:Glycosyltransferase family 87
VRRALRDNAACTIIAAIACAALAWLGLYGYAWNDYDNEARLAVDALVSGHFAEFVRLAPAYGGSLLERAPFAFAPRLWGGGELATYRMLALPCLLAAGALGVWLCAQMRAEDRPRLARGLALGLCVANPVILPALELGHPEELLGGCLVVAAVLLAGRSRQRSGALLAGTALGLAFANKQWALLAAGPVLLATPPGLRLRLAAVAVAVAGAVLAPLFLTSTSFVASTRAVASSQSPIFQPWQAWWFLGHHGALVHGLFGTPKPGYRVAVEWAGAVARPLIMLCGIAITAVLWRRDRRLSSTDALLVLALLLLVRCVLDTWDNVYYTLPFIVALLVWEVRARPARAPFLATLATVLVWASFKWLPGRVSPDAQAALFLSWSVPLVGWLAAQLRAGGQRAAPRLGRWRAALAHTTVISLGRLVRTSLASSPTATRSSMRTPTSPGR